MSCPRGPVGKKPSIGRRASSFTSVNVWRAGVAEAARRPARPNFGRVGSILQSPSFEQRAAGAYRPALAARRPWPVSDAHAPAGGSPSPTMNGD